MKFIVYCIRDNQGDYMRPTIYTDERLAKRDFKMWINTPDSLQLFNPSDFDFYKIGEFDSETGEIVGCKPLMVAKGPAYVSE